MKKRVFVVCLLCLTRSLSGQTADSSKPFLLDPVILGADDNFIENDKSLSRLFLMMDSVKRGTKQKLTILHIGDSHIQGDYLSRTIRYRLQKEFGEAGRGLVFPYSLLNMYGPVDYACSSNVAWQHTRMFPRERNGPVGLAGYAVLTNNPNMKLDVKLFKPGKLNYGALTNFDQFPENRFNTVKVLYSNDSSSLPFTVAGLKPDNSTGQSFFAPQFTKTSSPGFQYAEFLLDGDYTSLAIRVDTQRSFTSPLRLYGLSFENSNAKGILFHMAGVGACQLSDFLGATHFYNQTVALQPDLIIFSLGANESCTRGFDTLGYASKYQRLIQDLKVSLPGVQFLISTPPDILFRGTRPPSMDPICRTLERIAYAENCGYWNLQKVMGGAWSNQYWFQNKLNNPDRIHFSPRGYDFLGLLFTEALLNSYTRLGYTPVDTHSVRKNTAEYRQLFTALKLNKNKPRLPVYKAPVGTVTAPRPLPQSGGALYHTVRSGESVYSISRKYGVYYRNIQRLNGFNDKTIIRPGQRIRVK
jgi:hypothetical protein